MKKLVIASAVTALFMFSNCGASRQVERMGGGRSTSSSDF